MTTQELAYSEIEQLIENFKNFPASQQSVRGEDDLDRVRSLERQIAQVDAEVDQNVYKLYGLTEDEIQILKGG